MGMMIHRRREGHLFPKTDVKPMAEPEIVEEVKPMAEPETDEVKEEKKEVKHTLDEINSLPFFSLKSLASSLGIDVKGKKGQELKAEVIEKLGL